MADFFRFPQTPHVQWLSSGEPREDKLLSTSKANELLLADLTVEEKVDGASVSLSALTGNSGLRTAVPGLNGIQAVNANTSGVGQAVLKRI